MRRLCLIMFFLGVVLVAVGVESLYAIVQQNEKCISVLAPQKCNSSASSYCQEEAKDGSCDAGDCNTCDSSAGVPAKICVYWDGCTCIDDLDHCVHCGNTDHLRGECDVASGICQCTNQQVVGTCPTGQSACWCPG